MNKARSVYVMESDGRFKIGASYDPEKRAEQLRIANPNVRLAYVSPLMGNAIAIESCVHNALKDSRCGHEWFSGVSLDEIQRVIEDTVAAHGSAPGEDIGPVAKNLLRIIKDKGLKKLDVAKVCGMTSSQFYFITSGRRVLRLDLIPQLATALGVNINDLYQLKDDGA